MDTPFKLGRDSAGQVMIRSALDTKSTAAGQRLVGNTQVYFLDEIILPPSNLVATLEHYKLVNFLSVIRNSNILLNSIAGTM